ncbi:MAG: PD40 domain-containing protein [Anaerolineae bacterium]|nr:PD40 domain-containing protein [Anaerolineae bacterium]
MRRLSFVSLLFAISALMVMSPARAAGWTATATTLDLIAGPGRTAAFLAPDGSRFAYIKGDDLCIYSIAGEKGDCVTLDDDISLDLDSVRWSPDGTKLAFSEDFILTFRDSDIWVYDTKTNAITDLTSAPNRDLKFLSNTDPNVIYTVDMIPQWTSDSQSIIFIRYVFNKPGDARAVFYKTNIKDGTIEELAPIDTHYNFSTYGFALSPDDSTIAYNIDTRGKEKDGTWFLDVATQKTKFAAAPVQETSTWTYQFSADGERVLSIGIDATGAIRPRPPEASPIYTLPVSGGRQQDLSIDSYVFSAGWGPEGSELAYATFDPLNKDQEGLYITSAPGQKGDLVLAGRFIAPSGRSLTPIFWAANNTLLVSQVPDLKLTVVQLKPS